jgi:hypothetical protein
VPVAEIEKAIALEAQADADAEGESPAKKKSVFMPGEMPTRAQQRGTVQKNIFSWKRGSYGETYRLAVTARALRPKHTNDDQAFAVVVSLECEDATVNVTQLVRARLAAARVRLRVPAA